MTHLIPTATPTLTGNLGKAWPIDVAAVAAKYPAGAPAELTVCSWLLYAPYAHPFWHSYLLACISLREVPNWPAAKINLQGATHELFLLALDPNKPMVLDDKPSTLHPANFVAQFIEPSDAAAAERIRQTAQDVIDGRLNPDTDYSRHWLHRFGASNVKGDPATLGETRIVIDPQDGTPARELVIPPQPGPQDMH